MSKFMTSLLWLVSYFDFYAQAVQYSSLYSLVICAASLQVAHSCVVYVQPNATTLCPKNVSSSSCHTLSWYNHNGSISDDTMVIFLKGTHSLDSTLYIRNRKNLTITGEAVHDTLSLTGSFANSDQTSHPVLSWISCNSSDAGIVFLNTSDIQIMNLGFDSCGTNITLHSDNGNLLKLDAALLFRLTYNVNIIQVIINNTYGYGVHMNCVFGNIHINDSFLLRASKTTNGKLGGNTRFWFGQSSDCVHQCYTKHAKLGIFRSSFTQGLEGSIGIEIIIDCPQVYVVMRNIHAVNNTGGNIALSLTNFDMHSPDTNKIHINDSIINGGRAQRGGGMRFWIRHNPEREHTHNNCYNDTYNIHSLLTVTNTNFSFNSAQKYGGAVYMSYYQSAGYLCRVEKVTFHNCAFVNNLGNGAVMESTKHLILADHASPLLTVSLEHCHIRGNSVSNNNSSPIINLAMTHIIVSDCSFMDNNGSVLSLQKSNMNFYGDIWFINNHADYGAALRICEASLIFLNNNTHIRFTNNTATFMGGAVYAYRSCIDRTPPCLFQPKLNLEKFGETLKLEFINNSASIAGDAIYGGSLDSCFTIANYSYNGTRDTAIMLPMFSDMTGQTGSSWVSSDPQGVCFCDVNEQLSHYQCQTEHPKIEVYPGEKFTVSMITIGQMYGSTPGSIKVTLDNKDGFDKLIVVRDRNASSSKCENMTFILRSKQKHPTIHFDIATSIDDKMYLSSSTLNLKVFLRPCPLGFVLKENINGGYSCDCDPILCTPHGCLLSPKCDIDRQEISFNGAYYRWFGCLKKLSSMTCELAYGHNCHYCRSGLEPISVFDPDDQCLPGRTGVLCGACKPGLSRNLESHRIYTGCRKCSNRNLLFLVPLFLISGIVLVVFLTIFNVTVTQGTLNGLVFYSTVAYSYPSVFRTGRHEFPWIFISWLNLDLGFEICAYNGMTGYQYIWLNFGYIVYLLCIQISIVYLSRKFLFFTSLVGKNVVNVLATITFLIYSRLLYICYYSFKSQQIFFAISNITSEPQKVDVLQLDGNLTFFGLKHIPLFILALICLIALFFFAFSLLLIQCLQRQSSRWCLRWVERLRPFHEAFTGPCHDNYRFWPGFLFLMRVLLFFQVIREDNKLGVAAICFMIMSLGGIFPRGIYKKWQLNVLEFLFHLNLSVTFFIAEHVAYKNRGTSGHRHHNKVAAYLSVSFASVLFVVILLYHIYNRIRDTLGWKVLTKWCSVAVKKFEIVKLRFSWNSKNDDERTPLLPQPLPPVIKFPDFREPLLED